MNMSIRDAIFVIPVTFELLHILHQIAERYEFNFKKLVQSLVLHFTVRIERNKY